MSNPASSRISLSKSNSFFEIAMKSRISDWASPSMRSRSFAAASLSSLETVRLVENGIQSIPPVNCSGQCSKNSIDFSVELVQ